MTEQKDKKQSAKTIGYFLIILGATGIGTRFIGGGDWRVVGIVKLSVSILVLAVGFWAVFVKKAD
jgi:hypothetical protein